MLTGLRAALALAILLFVPQLFEQFESPKAAAIRVIGAGLLAAALTRVAGARPGAAAPAGAASGATGAGKRARRHDSRPGRGRSTPAPAAATSVPARWTALDAAMLAWLLVEAAATLFSRSPAISLFGEAEQHEGLLTSIGLAGLYAGARFGTLRGAQAGGTIAVTLSAVAISCGVAFGQFYTIDPAQWHDVASFGEAIRPFGSLGHANLLGGAAAAAFAAAVAMLASRPGLRVWPAAGALLFGATVLMTLSRGAWLGALAGGATALALGLAGRRRAGAALPAAKLALALGAALAVTTLAVVLTPPLRARAAELLATGSGSGRARLEIWKTALAMWRERPWLGQGPDAFGLMFGRFQTPDYWKVEWGAIDYHAHSIYLHALATRGALGALAALGVAIGAALALRAAWRDAGARPLAAAHAGVLAALAVAGAFGAIGVACAAWIAATLGMLPGLAATPAAPADAPRRPARSRSSLAPWLTATVMAAPSALQLLASHESFLARERPPGPQAILAAERATRLAPWNDLHAARLAETLRQNAWNSGDVRGALVRADSAACRAVALAPGRSFDHQVLGLARLARFAAGEPQQADSAAAEIARCMALAPYNVLPALQFAQEISRLGRADLALPGAERAAAAYPDEALPRAVLGGVRLAMGDSAAARRELVRARDATWHEGPLRRADVEQLLQRLGSGPR